MSHLYLPSEHTDADLVLAADVFVYVAALEAIFGEVHRVLKPGGFFAFTVQAHDGDGVILGADSRYSHGEPYLRALAETTGFGVAAFEHSQQMARRGFFAHRSADGSSFAERVRHYYGPGGYRYWSIGENLIWSSGMLAPSGVVESWMRSPGHRTVLLDSRWRELGISAVQVEDAPGVYQGMDVTIVTADFGVRR